MRAYEFLREYSREKTAGVFGNKLIAGLAKDRSRALPNQLGTARDYLHQRAKLNGLLDPQDPNRTDIINSIIDALESADPTSNKQYVQWLVKVYANEGVMMEDLTGMARDWLETYDLYKKKRLFTGQDAGLANIMNLKYNDLADISEREDLAANIEKQQAKILPKGDAETVFENGQVRIIHPKDQEAACYYGQGTRWCTAGKKDNRFNEYNRDGPMYILLPKQPKYAGEKYQLHVESGQFVDEKNNQVDGVAELIDMRFGSDVVEFFIRVEPQIKDWLSFTPNKMLEPLIAKIKTAVEQYAIFDIVNVWETTDDSWYAYLRDQGHVYPEGHADEGGIDWDAVADADLSYTDWNDDAADFINKIVGAVDFTPEELKVFAQEVNEHMYNFLTIEDLADVMIDSIDGTIGRRNQDRGVAKWIKDHINIEKRDDQWDVSLLYSDSDGKRKEYAIN